MISFDMASLSEIPYRHLFRYLVSRGWYESNSAKFTDITIMRKIVKGQEEEIVIPRDQEFADFNQRMFDVLSLLSRFENRELNDILNDLWSIGSDILRLRISGSSVDNSTIPFLDEMAIKNGLKKMLLSIACQVLEPRLFYKKLHRSEAEQLLRGCKIGQSEKGSYIIKFYFPFLYSNDIPKVSNENEKPFSRRVAEQLMLSLKNLIGYVENQTHLDSNNSPFNANFCFGLVEMKSNESKMDLDFQVSWSEAVAVDANIPSKIKIYDSYLPVISKIGVNMKPQQEITQSDFFGKITTLNGSENEKGLMEGEITLAFLGDDELKKAKAYLNPTFYIQACDAHKNGKHVRIFGLLKERPRLSIIDDISNFEVLSS
jgi:hypothetical protein